MTDHLLTPRDELQETPLGKAYFSCFTNGSYFKNENEKTVLVMLL